MILKMFCVYDRATEVFGTPMFLVAAGQAVRSFSDEVNRKGDDNQLYNHPDDFDLYDVGEWDNSSGKFMAIEPVVLSRGKDVSLKYVEVN